MAPHCTCSEDQEKGSAEAPLWTAGSLRKDGAVLQNWWSKNIFTLFLSCTTNGDIEPGTNGVWFESLGI